MHTFCFTLPDNPLVTTIKSFHQVEHLPIKVLLSFSPFKRFII